MTYLPPETPWPIAQPWEQRFWDLANEGRLCFQGCRDCGLLRHPPAPICPDCHSPHDIWKDAGDEAELYTYTVVHYASHPALAESLPYISAIVRFPELQSVRLVTNIVDCDPTSLRIGMRLTLVWEEPQPGRRLPRFRPHPEECQ